MRRMTKAHFYDRNYSLSKNPPAGEIISFIRELSF